MLVGLGVGVVVLLLTTFLGKGIPNKRKNMPFECGVPGVGSEGHRISVRFYLVAILFLLFDVEGIFFFPWAVVYKKYLTINSFILLEMWFFVAILFVGYVYVLRKGALEWE
jgi:NADH-quinone oxidoreductase subunit A